MVLARRASSVKRRAWSSQRSRSISEITGLVRVNHALIATSPEQFAEFIRADARNWGKVLRDANDANVRIE